VRPSRYFELLQVLDHHDVSYIVVGGVAAIVEGAPVTTLDLDIVYEQTAENTEHLTEALLSINAHYRDPAGRYIVPDQRRLMTTRTNLLATDLGPLDVLSEIGEGERYYQLLGFTRVRTIGGIEVRILGLEKVIETKEAANRDKDRAVLPVLRKTLEMQRLREGD
jgi:hypothetical protein